MAQMQTRRSQMNGKTFFKDGGLETAPIFQEGVDLPPFAALTLSMQSAWR